MLNWQARGGPLPGKYVGGTLVAADQFRSAVPCLAFIDC